METQFSENPLPEMLRLSLQDLALRIKIMKLGASIEEVLSQALDPPSTTNVQRAIAALVEVKALDSNEEVTPLGRHLVKLPMDVHMGKLLILACLFQCLGPALTVAAASNSKSPFAAPFGREQEADRIKRTFIVENSDFLTVCRVHNAWRNACSNGIPVEFCRKYMLSHPNLLQIEELRIQLHGFLIDAGFAKPVIDFSNGKIPFCNVHPDLDMNVGHPTLLMACIGAAMYPKLLVQDSALIAGNTSNTVHGGWRTFKDSAPASIHPSSVNFNNGRPPDFGDARFIAYFNIMQSKRLYVWESGVVDTHAIILLCADIDFKMAAGWMIIGRKMKLAVDPRTLLVLKVLRQRFLQLFDFKMKSPSKPFDSAQSDWFSLLTTSLTRDEKPPMALGDQRAIGDFVVNSKDIGVDARATMRRRDCSQASTPEQHGS